MKIKVKNIYENMLFGQKILLLLICTIAIQIISSVVFNYTVVRRVFSKNNITYTNDILMNLKSNVEEHMKNVENISQNIIYNEDIYNVLKMCITGEDELENYQTQKNVNSVLKDISYPHNEVQTIILYNNNMHPYIMDINNNFDLMNKETERIARRVDSAGISWSYINGRIMLTRQICDKNTMEKIGVMVIEVKRDLFETMLKSMGNHQDIALVSKDIEIINSSKSDYHRKIDNDIYKKYIEGNSGHYINRKTKEFVCFSALENCGWSIISTIPLEVLYKEINRTNVYTILVGLISCIAIIFLNRVFSNSVQQPIKTLIQRIEKFKKENVLEEVDRTRKDEFGYLEQSFNEMAKHLKEVIETVYLEKIARKNAHIKALQEQINPHFVYNTLESISWMARMNNDTTVSEMINVLASLMDVNTRKRNKIVTLKEEIAYIEDYYKIIKFRFGDDIEFRYCIEKSTEEVKIPCLLIQPIIENCINHGLDNVLRKGIVYIKCYIKGEDCFIEITDNGIGIDEDRMEEIQDKLKQSVEVSMQNTDNVGIINTNNRIKLFCGEEYGLEINSIEGHFCKVTIRVPRTMQGGSEDDV